MEKWSTRIFWKYIVLSGYFQCPLSLGVFIMFAKILDINRKAISIGNHPKLNALLLVVASPQDFLPLHNILNTECHGPNIQLAIEANNQL